MVLLKVSEFFSDLQYEIDQSSKETLTLHVKYLKQLTSRQVGVGPGVSANLPVPMYQDTQKLTR